MLSTFHDATLRGVAKAAERRLAYTARMRLSASSLALLACGAASAAAAAPGAVFDVRAYGAVGDGAHDDTGAVRAAFAAAASNGPSTVLFPAGYVFLTGAFNLSADLVVEVRGAVKAWPGSDGGHYWLESEVPWFGPASLLVWASFIHSEHASNITLRGGGTVDGNGAAWWACGCKGNPPPPAPPTNQSAPCSGFTRPKLVHLLYGRGLVIRDLTFMDSPMWNLRPSHFDDVYISNVTVLAPNGVACNSDGIDPDGVQNALIEDSYISVGDDAIAIKSGFNWYGRAFGRPSSNITFRRMRIGTGHGISIGSEMSANVTDVLFEDFVLDGTQTGPRIKSERGRGGVVANVTFRNITMAHVGSAFQVTEYYIDPPPPTNASATPRFYNITLEGLTYTTKPTAGAYFNGLPESIIEGVTMRNVDLGGTKEASCAYTTGACEGTVLPACPSCLAPA